MKNSKIKLLLFTLTPNVNGGDPMPDLHTDGGRARNDVGGIDMDFICPR